MADPGKPAEQGRLPPAGSRAGARGRLRGATVIGTCVAMAFLVGVRTSPVEVSRTVTEQPVPAVSGPSEVPPDPAAALGGLLDERAAALRAGDRGGWLAGLAAGTDDRTERFRLAQGRLFDRVHALRPATWSYQVTGGSRLLPDRRAELGPAAWLAEVRLEYQLTEGGPVVRRQQFHSVLPNGAGGWSIADDTDGSTGRDVWDLGPITHAISARCLVIGAQQRRTQVEQLAAECGRPARTVDRAWGTSWPRRTVLTVPDTIEHLAVLLGRAESDGEVDAESAGARTAGLEQTAAVTIGPAAGAADGVLVNGTAFDQLSPVGRRVVLAHELVHVATRATGSVSAPTWLAEGYADHVAYADSGLAAEQVAGEAVDAARAGQVPPALPAADDFNAAHEAAAAAYGRSWVAAELIAAKAGSQHRMKAFYQQADSGDEADLEAALAELGLGSTAGFTRIWQARLRQLAQ